MMVNMHTTTRLLVICLGLLFSGLAAAAGYGVQEQDPSQSQAIRSLLSNSNAAANTQGNPSVSTKIPPGNMEFGASAGSQQAFTNAVHNLMPLSPSQIRTLHYLFSRSQQAASEYPGIPPRPTSSTVLVNLSPGAAPPIIRLRAGYVTSLVFLDSTGASWPIIAYDIGDPQAFNIEPNQPDGKSNTLLVQALDNYKSGNLAVMLKGEDTPIMVTLMPGQSAVDYRVDLRVPGFGPNASPIISGLPAAESPQLINFLDGVPPNGALTLMVTGGDSQAWLYAGNLYLRTRLTVLSPSWISSMSSPDGTHVYELVRTPIVLASLRGQIIQLAIKGL